MRRWLAILLLVLLPAQTTWAVVAGYCVHESSAAASHFGHHDHASHSHAPGLPGASGTPESNSDATASVVHDCGHCHGLYASMLITFEPLQLKPNPGLSAPTSDQPRAACTVTRPERPKWEPLA
jgi:hypothetical protein